MAAYNYKALDGTGREVRGTITADSQRAARAELRGRRLTPLDVVPARERIGGAWLSSLKDISVERISPKELVTITRQLSTLIGASLPVEEALGLVARQSEKAHTASVLHGIKSDVAEGRKLSRALEARGAPFSSFYCSLVAAGEEAGTLGVVLERLADYLDRRQQLSRKIVGSLVYPAALSVVALSVVTILMVYVVPKVVDQLTGMGQTLPLLTRILIGISAFLQSYGLIVLLLVLAFGFGFGRALRQDPFRLKVDGFLLKVPFLGLLIRKVEAARFSSTLATLMESGVPVLTGFKSGQGVVSNRVLKSSLDASIKALEEGRDVAAALALAGFIPPMMLNMVAAGQKSGTLTEMLNRSAGYLESDFEVVTDTFLNVLEPAIIIVMGGIVALIVLSILLPILQFNTLSMM